MLQLINRAICEVKVTVDKEHTTPSTSITGNFSSLRSSLLYLGGAGDDAIWDGSGKSIKNFTGCLKKVGYQADSMKIDILRWAKKENQLFHIEGGVSFKGCSQAIFFASQSSSVILEPWLAIPGSKLHLEFRTVQNSSQLVMGRGRKDFFGLEVFESQLYLIINYGGGTLKAKISEKPVNDGLWHDVRLEHNGETGKVYLDQDEFIRYSSDRKSAELNLASGSLYLGALNQSSDYPKEFWSGKLGFGFQGCIRRVELNDRVVDLWNSQKKQTLYGEAVKVSLPVRVLLPRAGMVVFVKEAGTVTPVIVGPRHSKEKTAINVSTLSSIAIWC
ncbi:DgyrCDS2041 [Dimorphilus gyrociliatus]|uniref:DgyrCDS2041 n=1 Tax=Dimorphilus gyrociliatus TaxID=2664684 RepID=A0A7I8VE62_9ANNE|nr:DgyrCDS2041 [Dimorphilus gyrociliatus]